MASPALPAKVFVRHAAPQGFSLVEVVVAITVFSLLFGVSLQIFGTGLRSARLGEAYTHATLLARSRLDTLGIEGDLRPGDDSGRSGERYRWRTTVEPYVWELETGDHEVAVRPYLATVEVMWDDGGKERSIQLSTVKLAPER